MRVDCVVQQREKESVADDHIASDDDGNSKARRHAHRVSRYNTSRRSECHDGNQRQENCRRQTPVVCYAALCEHDYRRAAQYHCPHQPYPPQHVCEDSEPEAPCGRAGEGYLCHEGEVCDCGGALVGDFFDLVEGLGFHVARECEEAGYGEQGEDGEED